MKTNVPNLQIGVMGGAFQYSPEAIDVAYIVGATLAKENCTVMTGATTGIPYATVLGAKDNKGFTVGVSPAGNAKEHTAKYKKPLEGHDAIIYANMGYNGREPILTSSCDGIICIGGEFGTLIEFGQGFYDGKILGVLTGVGGISEEIKNILSKMNSDYGSQIIYDPNPVKLTQKVIQAVKMRQDSAKYIYEDTKELGEDVKKILLRCRK